MEIIKKIKNIYMGTHYTRANKVHILKWCIFDFPLDSLSKLDQQSSTVSNYSGGEGTGASWTDKVMSHKKQDETGNQPEGVDDDEWVSMNRQSDRQTNTNKQTSKQTNNKT